MEFSTTTEKTYAKPVVNLAHPPIIRAGKFAAGQRVLPAGTVLTVNEDGDYIKYDTDAFGTSGICAVLTKELDTDTNNLGSVLRHGMVTLEKLDVQTEEIITALEKNTIYI